MGDLQSKTIRISGKAYSKLQELAEKENIGIREALDVLAGVRDRLEPAVQRQERELARLADDVHLLKSRVEELIDELEKQMTFRWPHLR